MKIINIKQNTDDWKEWRGKGLGASDAPTIMGESPWSSVLELWLDKTGIYSKPEANAFAVAAMRRGTELEPKARQLFETSINASFMPVSAEHDEFPFIRASFDGYNATMNQILEIKCPGKIDHAKAIKGEVPEKYKAQIQQQLLVSGANMCHYFSWDGETKWGPRISVFPDYEYQAQLLGELIAFYDCVTKRLLPSVNKSDIMKVIKSVESRLAEAQSAITVLKILTDGTVPLDKEEEKQTRNKRGLINVR